MNDLIDICISKNENKVDWNVDGKTITIYNEHLLYAFKHGRSMLMIKEKDEASECGYSTYDTHGNIIFSYKYLDHKINFRDTNIFEIDGQIISVDYEEEKNIFVILKEKEKTKSLLLYDENFVNLAEIKSPNGYIFISLKNCIGNIMVVAQGTDDITKDSFGRNDWNFTINFDNFFVEKKSITQ